MSGYGCQPICCPPQYCVRDFYTQRLVPVIHPIVNINRQNVIDVPQHVYQQTSRNVVVNRGFAGPGVQGQGFLGQGYEGYPGYANRLFF